MPTLAELSRLMQGRPRQGGVPSYDDEGLAGQDQQREDAQREWEQGAPSLAALRTSAPSSSAKSAAYHDQWHDETADEMAAWQAKTTQDLDPAYWESQKQLAPASTRAAELADMAAWPGLFFPPTTAISTAYLGARGAQKLVEGGWKGIKEHPIQSALNAAMVIPGVRGARALWKGSKAATNAVRSGAGAKGPFSPFPRTARASEDPSTSLQGLRGPGKSARPGNAVDDVLDVEGRSVAPAQRPDDPAYLAHVASSRGKYATKGSPREAPLDLDASTEALKGDPIRDPRRLLPDIGETAWPQNTINPKTRMLRPGASPRELAQELLGNTLTIKRLKKLPSPSGSSELARALRQRAHIEARMRGESS